MIRLQKLMTDLTCGDEERAEAAAKELTVLGERAAMRLQRLYAESDADLRWWSLRAAAEIHCDISKSILTAGLGDSDNGVRCCAALGLRHQPASQAIPKLIGLLGDPDKLLARLAADALTSIGEQAVPGLLAVMQNSPQEARLEAVRALARIGDQRAIPILFKALEDDSALVEYWANEGLEKMGVGMVFFKP